MKKINQDVIFSNRDSAESDGVKTWPMKIFSGVYDKNVNAVPLVLFLAIAAIVVISSYSGLLPKNMIGGLAVIMTLGFVLSHIGRSIPLLKDIGGPAILCLMVPL